MATRRTESEADTEPTPIFTVPRLPEPEPGDTGSTPWTAPPLPPPPPPPAPAPPPAPSILTGIFRGAIGAVVERAQKVQQTVDEARAVILAAAPLPSRFTMADFLAYARNLRELARSRPELAEAIATIEAAYPPKDDGSGGLFSALGSAVSGVVNAGEAVIDTALDSAVFQASLAAATGGMSLAVQAAIETATGDGGRITNLAGRIVDDPASVLKEVPGVLLTETGLPGAILESASLIGAGLEGGFGSDSTVGQVGGAVHGGVEDLQQAAREEPVASLELAAGAALLAAGIPLGGTLVAAATADLVNNAVENAGAPPAMNAGIVPPELQQPAASQAAAAEGPSSKTVKLVVGAVVTAGLVGLVAALGSESTDSNT